MNDDNIPALKVTDHNPVGRQVGSKTKRRLRARSSEGTLAYWKERLVRNSYRDRSGNTVEIPEYYVRLRYEGLTKRVRLHTSDKDRAAEEALRLSERLFREGWNAITSGLARLPASPTIDEFCGAYQKATTSMESPPRPISIALYLRHFRQICKFAGVSRLRELTPEAVERARDKYRAFARSLKRTDSAIQNSLGIILRNAAACFSGEARAILARHGLAVENPFAGIRRSQKIEPVSALSPEVVERLWKELPLLRDGDPNAEAPNFVKFAKKYRKDHQGRNARWLPIDFRKPHPDAYCAILLAHGAGLRANEIDKARWSWLKFDAKGNTFLEIGQEPDFKPKGGTLRAIQIPTEMSEALKMTRTDFDSPYILGGQASKSVARNGWGYRRRETLRIVSTWLRERGIETDEQRGNPLHRLRKQFGSEVATRFGLFPAQKLLGHTSPAVTAKYYAAQTELPILTHIHIAG